MSVQPPAPPSPESTPMLGIAHREQRKNVSGTRASASYPRSPKTQSGRQRGRPRIPCNGGIASTSERVCRESLRLAPVGVDPLGLRQINFDLMDQVFPGLNNVARHIRPFVLVAWAWRRANQLAKTQGTRTIPIDQLRDFVDRIEVIYVWSQFLTNPSSDLPGRQVLANLLQAKDWTFGGSTWRQRRTTRRYSTALTAPINYGPALKMLGWVQSHPDHSEILIPTATAAPALDAFEARIADRLNHPAFSKFGSVTVTATEARGWSKAWALDKVTKAEADAMNEMLFGTSAPLCRQKGGKLMLAAAKHSSTTEVDVLRRTMAGPPSRFKPATDLLTRGKHGESSRFASCFDSCWRLCSTGLSQILKTSQRTQMRWSICFSNNFLPRSGIVMRVSG